MFTNGGVLRFVKKVSCGVDDGPKMSLHGMQQNAAVNGIPGRYIRLENS